MTVLDIMLHASKSITQQHIEDSIKSKEFHLFRGTRHIVCCATMHCGYSVVGESACISQENFSIELGQKYAQEDAERKIGALLAYEQALKLTSGDKYEH